MVKIQCTSNCRQKGISVMSDFIHIYNPKLKARGDKKKETPQTTVEEEGEKPGKMEFEYDAEHVVALDTDRAFILSSSSSSSSLCSTFRQCRICHEEEESSAMETPCACSGTLKFAHRGCIQRWCDEKGSTLCEICLQNFEPTYTVAPKKALIDVGVTIRGSLEVPRLEYHPPMISFSTPEDLSADFNQSSPALRRRASCCRSMALTLTLILLLRHLVSLATIGAEANYAFTLLLVCLLRACGVVLPCYLIIKMVLAMQRIDRQEDELRLQETNASLRITSGDTRLLHRTIEIRS